MEAAQLDPAEIQHVLQTLATREEMEMTAVVGNLKLQMQEVASIFADADEKEKVETYREIFKGLLTLEDEVHAHKGVLMALRGSYAPTMEPTDFAAVLEANTRKAIQRRKFNPEANADMAAFDRDVGREAPAGASGANGDDDLVMENDGALMNDKCPITMRSVLELDDPVQDSRGFIYDAAAIKQHIRANANKGPVKCPVAGTSHFITLNELQPAAAVKRAKRRALFAQGTQQGGNATGNGGARAEEVLDASDED